jgi:chromosome segregation ATPase
MAEWNGNWSDPSLWIGAGGGFAAIVAVIKTAIDWLRDRDRGRESSEERAAGSLLDQIRDLRHENEALREELADARKELLATARMSERRLREYRETVDTRLHLSEKAREDLQRQLYDLDRQLAVLRSQRGDGG